jgi:8-oxo-dGTP pyrophosphatase MutT (NUDIX family)
MGLRESRLVNDRSHGRADQVPARFVPVSQLRRLRERIQVAAVCYRVGRKGMEFLLVQTRGSGRWTFPKGGVEPGLTHAQAAALEAFEEAGVHGRMEEASFARYVRPRGNGKKDSNQRKEAVNAHLCEVSRLGPTEESGRNPTWFSPEKAQRKLREDRSSDFADELAGVVDRAVARIQRLRSTGPVTDALQEVQFEAFQGTNSYRRAQEASFARYIRSTRDHVQQSAAIELAVHAQLSKVLQFVPPQDCDEDSVLLPAEAKFVCSGESATRIPLLSATSASDNALQRAQMPAPDYPAETALPARAARPKKRSR